MKKKLSLLVMGLLVVLPFSVKAKTVLQVPISCTSVDSNGYKTCTVVAETNDGEVTVTLTEEGGAEVTDIQNGDWLISSKNKSGSVWTVVLSGPEDGEITLFKFTYKGSGETDCRVVLSTESQTIPTPPDTETDKPTPQKQTGSSLPYVALGAIALLAGGAYVTTKNKAKMYRL